MIFTLLYDKIFFLNDGLCEMYVLLAVSTVWLLLALSALLPFFGLEGECFGLEDQALASRVQALASRVKALALRFWP